MREVHFRSIYPLGLRMIVNDSSENADAFDLAQLTHTLVVFAW